VLGVREEPGRPLIELLLAALGPEQLLLVLDNCEHPVQACTELAVEILRASPSVRILATSCEVLGVAGEVTWTVPSLCLPDPDRPPSERLAESEAVRLFVERARLVASGFAVTEANAARRWPRCAAAWTGSR
jgi:predicted ATPase